MFSKNSYNFFVSSVNTLLTLFLYDVDFFYLTYANIFLSLINSVILDSLKLSDIPLEK